MDTTAPSGDWLDRILGSASDLGDKWMDFKVTQWFRDESGAADNAEITDNWQRLPGYDNTPPQKDNTALYIGGAVVLLVAIIVMKN